MSALDDALFTFLTANVPSVDDRVYPLRMPTVISFPTITYQRLSGQTFYTQTGPDSLSHPTYELSVWGQTFADCRTGADQAKQALSGFRGMMGSVPVSAVFVGAENDTYDPTSNLYRTILHLSIWCQE